MEKQYEHVELLITVEDLENEERMAWNRLQLDAGAKAARPQSRYHHEEIVPYVVEVENPTTNVRRFLPETDETRKYRVLRRFYE